MQVRSTRRRRKDGETLPPLPPLEEGRFREVKTGVLLLSSQRVEISPGRRTGLGWVGTHTVVVIVGDGAEWIWNRATMFVRRCEILDF